MRQSHSATVLPLSTTALPSLLALVPEASSAPSAVVAQFHKSPQTSFIPGSDAVLAKIPSAAAEGTAQILEGSGPQLLSSHAARMPRKSSGPRSSPRTHILPQMFSLENVGQIPRKTQNVSDSVIRWMLSQPKVADAIEDTVPTPLLLEYERCTIAPRCAPAATTYAQHTRL